MTLTWKCEAGEPGRKTRPTWTAEIGPVKLTASMCDDGAWGVSLRGPVAEVEGVAYATLGDAMECGEPWAHELLEHWRDLGALARAALVAMDGP